MGKFDGMDPKLVRELLAEVKRAAAELRGVEGRVAQAMTRADLATRTTHRPSQVAEAGDKMIRDVTVRLGELEKRADHPRTNGTADGHAPTAIGDATKDHPADQPDNGDQPHNGDKNDKGAKGDKPHADATSPAQPKPDQHPEHTEDPKHGAKPDADAKKDPDAKTGHDTKPDTKPDDKPDAKPEQDAKPDAKPEDKPDAKPDDKPDAKPEQDAKPDDKPDAKPEQDAKPDACDDVKPDAPQDPDPGSEKGGVDLPDQAVDVPDQRVDVPDQGVDLPDQGTHDASVKSPPPGGDASKPQVVVVDGVKVLQVPIDPPTAEELQNLLRNLDGVQPAHMPTPVGDSTPNVPDAYGDRGGDAVSVDANPADHGGVHAATGDALQLQPYGMPDADTTLPTHPATADAPDTPSSDAACQQPDTGTGRPSGDQPGGGTGRPDAGAGQPAGGQPDRGTGQPDTGVGHPSGGQPDTGTGRSTVIPPTLPAADGGGAVGTDGQGVSAAPGGHGSVPNQDGGAVPGTHGPMPSQDAGAVSGSRADGMVPGGKGDEGVYLPEVDGEGNVVVRAGAGNDVVGHGAGEVASVRVTAGGHGEVASGQVAAEGPPGTAGDGTPERSA